VPVITGHVRVGAVSLMQLLATTVGWHVVFASMVLQPTSGTVGQLPQAGWVVVVVELVEVDVDDVEVAVVAVEVDDVQVVAVKVMVEVLVLVVLVRVVLVRVVLVRVVLDRDVVLVLVPEVELELV